MKLLLLQLPLLLQPLRPLLPLLLQALLLQALPVLVLQ